MTETGFCSDPPVPGRPCLDRRRSSGDVPTTHNAERQRRHTRSTGQSVSLTSGFRDWTRDQRSMPAGIPGIYMTRPATGWCGNLPGGLSQRTTAPPADHYHRSPGSVCRKKRGGPQGITIMKSSPADRPGTWIEPENESTTRSVLRGLDADAVSDRRPSTSCDQIDDPICWRITRHLCIENQRFHPIHHLF